MQDNPPPSDNNLFFCLSTAVDDSALIVRQIICDYLINNEKILGIPAESFVRACFGTCLNNYVSKMRFITHDGGPLEIYAFCELYDMIVHVNTTIRHYIFRCEDDLASDILSLTIKGNKYHINSNACR